MPDENAASMCYDREVLTTVLIYHQRTDTSGCHCGWADLGLSYADHVADVYEQSISARCALDVESVNGNVYLWRIGEIDAETAMKGVRDALGL